ncbi:MAG: extracellular solute-binding protein [Planctomycetota bacterium]
MKRKSPLYVFLILLPWVAWGLYSLWKSRSPGPAPREVVVYCALDRLYAQPLLDGFTRRTGIVVRAKWDSEATKTTGLVQALLAERAAPRCDVFWNNEVSQTIQLARAGALQAYDSPQARGLPAWARDPGHLWTGFAARARVLLVNRTRVPEGSRPRSVQDLLDPRWKGQVGIAKPLFGTTATQVAAWFSRDGEAKAKAFFDALKANGVVVCAGNADVKDRVAAGELAFGWTDSDDANVALEAASPVQVVFPDQGQGERGTLLIPNAASIVAGAPHAAEARELVDFLLSPEVEELLSRSRSAQIPLRKEVARPAWIPQDLVAEPIDWPKAADAFPRARDYVEQSFLKE